MIHTIRAAAAAATIAGVTALTSAAGAHQSIAYAGKNCNPPKYPGSGYFTSLKVTGTSCARGKTVTLAHYRCRVRHGRAGRCSSLVLRFRCSERRATISTEIDSVVTCRKGDARVVYSYQQNT